MSGTSDETAVMANEAAGRIIKGASEVVGSDKLHNDGAAQELTGDSSLEHTLAILKMVVFASGSQAIESPPLPSHEGSVKETTLEEWRELERAEVEKRVADFRGRQHRIRQAREAYCESMLEKTRA